MISKEIDLYISTKLTFTDIAKAFSEISSESQAILLQEMFDALIFKCKNDHNLNVQIKYIVDYAQSKNFKSLLKAIDSLSYETKA